MTRDEFVAYQSIPGARRCGTHILAADDAPRAHCSRSPPTSDQWVDLYLAALEEAGLLRPDGAIPPIRTQQHIVSLMTTLASGILFGPGGQRDPQRRRPARLLRASSASSTATRKACMADDRLHGSARDASTTRARSRSRRCRRSTISTSGSTIRRTSRPSASTCRGCRSSSAAPACRPISRSTAPEPVDGDRVRGARLQPLLPERGRRSAGSPRSPARRRSTPPAGCRPSEALPYIVGFENAAGAGAYVNEIRIVTELDPELDPRSFTLRRHQDRRHLDRRSRRPHRSSRREIDFTATRGFILRVSARCSTCSRSRRAASWLIQAIDPLTGEVLEDTTPRPARRRTTRSGRRGRVRQLHDQARRRARSPASASTPRRACCSTAWRPRTPPCSSQAIDAPAPSSRITAARIGTTNDFQRQLERRSTTTAARASSTSRSTSPRTAATSGSGSASCPTRAGSLVFAGEAGQDLRVPRARHRRRGQPRSAQAGRQRRGRRFVGQPRRAARRARDDAAELRPAAGAVGRAFDQRAVHRRPKRSVPARRSADPPERVRRRCSSRSSASAFATGITPERRRHRPDGDRRDARRRLPHLRRRQPRQPVALRPARRRGRRAAGARSTCRSSTWPSTRRPAVGDHRRRRAAAARSRDRRRSSTASATASPSRSRSHPGHRRDLRLDQRRASSIFDPDDRRASTHWSRDENLRVGSLAFDGEGKLWAVTWPDRTQVVRFTDRAARRDDADLRFAGGFDRFRPRTGPRSKGCCSSRTTPGAVGDDGTGRRRAAS